MKCKVIATYKDGSSIEYEVSTKSKKPMALADIMMITRGLLYTTRAASIKAINSKGKIIASYF